MPRLVVVDHPLLQHKLSLMRRKDKSINEFRRLMKEIAPLMLYEATRDLPLTYRDIETPVASMQAPFLAGKKLCIVPILRAGLGFADAMIDLVPSARVGHVGVVRDPTTYKAMEYLCKLPSDLDLRRVLVVDPMLATGNSAVAVLTKLHAAGATNVKLVCLLAAPEGVEAVSKAFPDVTIFVGAVDEKLTDHAYISPGLGDAGDRLFGTRS
jgi:uracil phosphoribosyltransferase